MESRRVRWLTGVNLHKKCPADWFSTGWMKDFLKRENPPCVWVATANRLIARMGSKGKEERLLLLPGGLQASPSPSDVCLQAPAHTLASY